MVRSSGRAAALRWSAPPLRAPAPELSLVWRQDQHAWALADTRDMGLLTCCCLTPFLLCNSASSREWEKWGRKRLLGAREKQCNWKLECEWKRGREWEGEEGGGGEQRGRGAIRDCVGGCVCVCVYARLLQCVSEGEEERARERTSKRACARARDRDRTETESKNGHKGASVQTNSTFLMLARTFAGGSSMPKADRR